ncbi:MAG: hypothetical protein CSA34_06910 [Desulfobulbus propionicus]|nr:MAG: hypothetical protein CSA34_06910 [Desulfobulbus propionicus]
MLRRAVRVFFAPGTPLWVKAILAGGLLYCLSPYDLIPEWLPVAGILDDVALAALLIAWAGRFSSSDDVNSRRR